MTNIKTDWGKQGETLSAAFFQQTEFWIDHDGLVKKIDEMPGVYILNVVCMLERCADAIFCEAHGYDAHDIADAQLWVFRSPLYQSMKDRLRNLIEKGEGRG